MPYLNLLRMNSERSMMRSLKLHSPRLASRILSISRSSLIVMKIRD